MNFLDIILGILLLYGALRGLIKGFLMEVASLVALVAGIYGAIHFSHFLTDLLADFVSWELKYRQWAGYGLTFVLIVWLIILVGRWLTKLAKLVALNLFNRILGGVFGLLKVGFVCSVLLMFANSLAFTEELIPEETAEKSVLYPYVEPVAPLLLPQIIEGQKEIDLNFDTQDILN